MSDSNKIPSPQFPLLNVRFVSESTHLFLPRNGDLAGVELCEELVVGRVQTYALDRAELLNVQYVLGVYRARLKHEPISSDDVKKA